MARSGKFQLSISWQRQEETSKTAYFVCSAMAELKDIGSGETFWWLISYTQAKPKMYVCMQGQVRLSFWWLISYTQAKPKMYTEIYSEHTSLKQ